MLPVLLQIPNEPCQTCRTKCLNVNTRDQGGKLQSEPDRYLLLLSAAPFARLVKQPSAKDWIHVDSYALDADQQDSTWSAGKYRKTINPHIQEPDSEADE